MKTFNPREVPHPDIHRLLLSGVAPRPIALVSTMDRNGVTNLSPYSFFNAFSSQPPVVALGPGHRATDRTAKDTYTNLLETGECTINAVTFPMVEQANLSSCNYAPDVDEFTKSGLTKRASAQVRPPGVAESPFIMECTLLKMIRIADLLAEANAEANAEATAGASAEASTDAALESPSNIALCRVELIHVTHSVFTGNAIDPQKMDLVGRMGLSWYTRARGAAVFELPQPKWNGIGFDALPEHIRQSTVLTGNDLARLAGVKELPKRDVAFPPPDDCADAEDFHVEFNAGSAFGALQVLLKSANTNQVLFRENLHKIAQLFIQQGNLEAAWQTLHIPA
jgi:flavin reductase (DIM6/NTAB) family NADH-FMN oxidoreductase RutF